ncbi:MAG: hypothetical protein RJA22_1220 [Verrucomicrobiota bacterium]|jgi:hypothetical protein
MNFHARWFCLFPALLLLTGARIDAAPVVLHETGWEPAPASPAWAATAVAGQNGWVGLGGSAARIRVIAEGSADATVFGQAYTTPTGSQFQRFTASSSTTAENEQYAWVDVTSAFASRPAGHDRLVASMDVLVPAGGAADASLYGLLGWSDGGNSLDFGIVVSPANQTLILLGADVIAEVPGLFAYNTWFNLSLRVNYQTGELQAFTNGVPVPGLTGSNPLLVGTTLEDVDLWCVNDMPSPNPRVIFTDNYRVVVEPLVDGPPGNDAFAQAGLLTGLTGTTNGSTVAATVEANEPEHAAISPTRTVWYRWVAPSTCWMTFDTLGGGLDTVAAVYTGPNVAALFEVAANDDAAPASVTQSRVTFLAAAGTTYYLVIDSKGSSQGTFSLRWRPTLRLAALPQPDNGLLLQVTAAAPGFYQLQSSASIAGGWETFDSVSFTAEAGGTVNYDLGTTAGSARRFYRVTQ